MASFGSAVRRQREQKQLSSDELAARAGMRPALLARIESGEHDPRLDELYRVAYALDTPLSALLREVEAAG